MKKVFVKSYLRKFLPTLIILISLLFSASISLAFSPQSPFFHTPDDHYLIPKNNIKKTPSTTPTKERVSVLGTKTPTILPTLIPTIHITPISTPIPTINETSSTQSIQNSSSKLVQETTSIQPTTTPQLPSLTPSITPVIVNIVTVEIKTPDSSFNFSVQLNDGMNVCDVLQEAKDEGKISSVTFDESYISSLHSKYVSEINGYKNNWTFTINGSSPLGCSLSNPKPNDTIIWKFG